MPLRFKRVQISSETFEAAAVFDVDGDGVLDIVTGGFWYQGPEFKRRHLIADDLRRYQDYYDEFSVIPMDVDGDGKLDFVTGGWWGNTLRWRKNPGGPAPGPWQSKLWECSTIADGIGNVETTRAWDIDGDGQLEIVPNTPGHALCAYKLVRDSAGRGIGRFTKHIIHSEGLGHGLGFGDVDGDGQGEFITPRGLLKANKADPLAQPWELVEALPLPKDSSIPVLVVDVNGDGLPDLICGHSHSYGLSWFEQRIASGKRQWIEHPIDPSASQYHDLHWADIDGDGKCELITGKRYFAHCGNDPGEYDDIGICYFKCTGESFAKHVVAYGPPGAGGAGCGIQFALADLRGTGRLDIVAPGKDGLKVFYNEGA